MRGVCYNDEAPMRRTPHRGLNSYRNNEAIQSRIASRVSETCSFTDSLTTGFIQHHLLSVKSVSNPRGKLAVFASQRKIVSSALAGNVPPGKKARLVYMGGR
jgi:hypothetical protein